MPENSTGAEFSPCGKYRYRLWRRWGDGPTVCFIMLNPSTADDVSNDPTVERCQRRAAKLGYGALEVVNLFALRSTDPKELYANPRNVGDGNNDAILAAAGKSRLVICGWGRHGELASRGAKVRLILRRVGIKLYCLGINVDGSPKHPLYVGYKVRPVRWRKRA